RAPPLRGPLGVDAAGPAADPARREARPRPLHELPRAPGRQRALRRLLPRHEPVAAAAVPHPQEEAIDLEPDPGRGPGGPDDPRPFGVHAPRRGPAPPRGPRPRARDPVRGVSLVPAHARPPGGPARARGARPLLPLLWAPCPA